MKIKDFISKEMIGSTILMAVAIALVWTAHENMPNGFKIKSFSKEA